MRYAMVFTLVLLLGACATQRYGRVQAVGANERTALTCEQIDVEIGKVVDFLNQDAAERKEFTGADVLGFLGDLGIGNDFEYAAAVDSGRERCEGLVALRSAKQCSAPTPPIDATKGDGWVKPALKACIPVQ